MKTKQTPVLSSGYDDTPAKKTVGLVVKFRLTSASTTEALQFPLGVSYHFETVGGDTVLVVMDGSKVLAHVRWSDVLAVVGPCTLFRDGRWK